jgi:Xaa-Pro aminopeptidase
MPDDAPARGDEHAEVADGWNGTDGVMDAETRAARIAKVQQGLPAAGLGLVVLAPTDNLRWVLGFAPLYDERACLLLVSARGVAMLMPSLNAEQARSEAPEIELVTWADDAGPATALVAALERVGGTQAATVGADPEMRADHLLLLQAAVDGASYESASAVLRPLREIKGQDELDLLAASARTADAAIRAAFAACRAGTSELAVAEAASAAFRDAGCEEVEFTIVASGPNGAFPHHHTGDRVLGEGDAIVLDLGGMLAGYPSDITRMAHVGEPSARYREVHAIVDRAVQAGMAAARPGARCEQVDAAARGVIEEAGFGEYFVHRTGHGLGLSAHEPPWIARGETSVLRTGMVHSIEPGIYLPGEFGVRLEEIVRITDDGCERFSSLPRELHTSA